MINQSGVIELDPDTEADTDEEDNHILESIANAKSKHGTLNATPRQSPHTSQNTHVHPLRLPQIPPSPQRSSLPSKVDGLKVTSRPSSSQLSDDTKISKKEERKAAATAKKLQKAREREEREAAKQAQKLAEVRQAFSRAEQSGTFQRRQVELVVSSQLFRNNTRKDVLSHARALFPDQIFPVNYDFPNLVTWRTRTSEGVRTKDPSHDQNAIPDISLFVFSGTEYWDMMISQHAGQCLSSVAKQYLAERHGDRIFYVIYGIEAEFKRRRNSAVRHGAKDPVISLQAVQDSYNALYMDFGIRTHAFADVTDAAKYIVELTDACAEKPYFRQDDFFDASLAYRDARKKLSNRSTVISVHEVAASQGRNVEPCVESEEARQNGNVTVNSDNEDTPFLVPLLRSEGSLDLGYMYLAFLALVPRMSFEKAISIRRAYSTFSLLQQAYQRCSIPQERYSLLANLTYGPKNRKLGPALSKSIAIVLTSNDPDVPFRL